MIDSGTQSYCKPEDDDDDETTRLKMAHDRDMAEDGDGTKAK